MPKKATAVEEKGIKMLLNDETMMLPSACVIAVGNPTLYISATVRALMW